MGTVLGFPGVDPLDAAIGARLRRWRTERAVEVETLAEALNLSPEAVSRVEAGRAHLTANQLGAATAHLHLPLWALVSDRPAY